MGSSATNASVRFASANSFLASCMNPGSGRRAGLRARRRPRRGTRQPPRSTHGLRGTRAGAPHGSRVLHAWIDLPGRRQRDLACPVLDLEDVVRRRRRLLRSVPSGPLALARRGLSQRHQAGPFDSLEPKWSWPSRRYGAGRWYAEPRNRTLVRCSCAWCLIWMSRNTYATSAASASRFSRSSGVERV